MPAKKYFTKEEKIKARRAAGKRFYRTAKGKYNSLKKNANNRSRKYKFELTFDEFEKMYWGKNCVYCGDTLKTIGVDRIDNAKGYSVNNCLPCCEVCNKMKLTMSLPEWLNHMEKIRNNFKVFNVKN